MRVVHAAALVAAALLVTSTATAQGIGDTAARERAKRAKTAGKSATQPSKVITDEQLVPKQPKDSGWPETSAFDEPAAGTQPGGATAAPGGGEAAAGEPAAGEAPEAGAAPDAPAAPDAAAAATQQPAAGEKQEDEAEARAKAEEQWRDDLDRARKDKDAYQQTVDKLMSEMNDFRYGYNTPGMATRARDLDEKKQKLAEVEARIEQLEETGRRAGYR